ncbi:DNA cytosine methyltransferase [Rhizobium johnstonii]|uniref:DNA cytosine methyltransferase n=1 Tax=Rhizobium johnstonii TaxID=3019933 RepID=UPI002FF2B461
MTKLKVLDLFSGIGGFSLGLERTGGFSTVAVCEIDEFCRRLLSRRFPNARQYDDVRTLTAERLAHDGIHRVNVITGGFPCQDVSNAGKRAGIEGSRSGLWSEIHRLAGELRPGLPRRGERRSIA